MKITSLPLSYVDVYKFGHKDQSPPGITERYSVWTPRNSRIPYIKEVVTFGVQYFVQRFLIEEYGNFFLTKKEDAVTYFLEMVYDILGEDCGVTKEHVEKLHDLGYLPICVKSLPEGTRSPIGVPTASVISTHPDFEWLTNYLETLWSCEIWGEQTVATIAYAIRDMLDSWADKTSDQPYFVNFQGHDFSMRGHRSVEVAAKSGAAHALSFIGSDTVPTRDFVRKYYGKNLPEKYCLIKSVRATEHSVHQSGGLSYEEEKETSLRLLTQVAPSGIISQVSDTVDYWRTLTKLLPDIKNVIMNRDGKLVVRPDSGNPVHIVAGYRFVDLSDYEITNGIVHNVDLPQDYSFEVVKTKQGYFFFNVEYDSYNNRVAHITLTNKVEEYEVKGSIQLLYELFGGSINSKGFIDLDPHIGLIYGDSMTYEKIDEICLRLYEKQFSSTNVVFGIGSFTYQYITRDTFGFAFKSTHIVKNGKDVAIYKDPKTDRSKRSPKGFVKIDRDNEGTIIMLDNVSRAESEQGLLKVVFHNGKCYNEENIEDIRQRLGKVKQP